MISRHSLALPRICLALKMLYCFGGDEENRTPDPLLARQVLSQLSYAPGFSLFCLPLWVVVGLSALCFRFDSEVALPRLIFRDKASCFRLFCSVFKVQLLKVPHGTLRTE